MFKLSSMQPMNHAMTRLFILVYAVKFAVICIDNMICRLCWYRIDVLQALLERMQGYLEWYECAAACKCLHSEKLCIGNERQDSRSTIWRISMHDVGRLCRCMRHLQSCLCDNER